MVLEWFFLTIFSAVAYSILDIMEKNLISSRIPSAVLLAIFLAVLYPINLAVIPFFFLMGVSAIPVTLVSDLYVGLSFPEHVSL